MTCSTAMWRSGSRNAADEVIAAFEEADAAVAPVYTAEDLLADPQVEALDMIPEVPDEDLGSLRMPGRCSACRPRPGDRPPRTVGRGS
ncbi:MAG: CoA transferase [Microthrixaceae bacterium]